MGFSTAFIRCHPYSTLAAAIAVAWQPDSEAAAKRRSIALMQSAYL